jgi:enamine deaminase RidA (YjgF/YER057c/UK114 family)
MRITAEDATLFRLQRPSRRTIMPMRRLISSGSSFESAFGYSRAIVDGDYIFVSGTTGYDYETMTMPEDGADQVRNIARTFEAVLAEADASLADAVRLQTFVTSSDYSEAVLRVQGEIFGRIRPAARIYVVSALLRPEMKVEIEATARIRRPLPPIPV